MVFNGLDEGDTLEIQNRRASPSHSPDPPVISNVEAAAKPASSSMSSTQTENTSSNVSSSLSMSKQIETIVIKIEDDEDDNTTLNKAKPDNIEVRTFQSEASVGELFGHRWRTEPVVGYTLVHFGGSDRTRMVPMNPTVPSLTVTFNRSEETITFSFRVLVNGLCLLSSGGGPPALHMPEMADDEEEEEEEEVVVVPDNDKDDVSPSPPGTASSDAPTDTKTATISASDYPEAASIADTNMDTDVNANAGVDMSISELATNDE
ncbi:hypothetical protein BCR41DRAFT_372099 [Lobosporangium transversale]|uniref:Uncharacterized protein n=1 Tax=Lobosporangium transversale TaxID=64571 RepID=A0A1Y2GJ47_9FUNG|nr:hypothetical protein BCR41DRAFT_372099 [Lobosporangium transversale]ORZ11262.1 hypothetical protein BCR41DRAFT_372099 [Lobosporangium transversale]|eukprot:XP_021879577.1 hypothetical protein BCR41DRAFT_372099 [Lobosporangium transversale]